MLLPACQLAGREFLFWGCFVAPQLMNMWISWVFLALLLFWAVGAYNRLIRLRSAALQALLMRCGPSCTLRKLPTPCPVPWS